MSTEELLEECLKMKKNESKTFQLDAAPQRGELGYLEVQFILARKQEGLQVSFLRNGLQIVAHCYAAKQ